MIERLYSDNENKNFTFISSTNRIPQAGGSQFLIAQIRQFYFPSLSYPNVQKVDAPTWQQRPYSFIFLVYQSLDPGGKYETCYQEVFPGILISCSSLSLILLTTQLISSSHHPRQDLLSPVSPLSFRRRILRFQLHHPSCKQLHCYDEKKKKKTETKHNMI